MIDFFLKIPLPLRLNLSFYKKFGVERLFQNNMKMLLQIPCTSLKTSSSLAFLRGYIFKKIPACQTIAKKCYLLYKRKSEYSANPMNWYAIMSKKEFDEFYTGNENINSFLVKTYMNRIRDGEIFEH